MYQYLDQVPSSKGEIGQISELTLQILDVLLSSANNSLNKQAVSFQTYKGAIRIAVGGTKFDQLACFSADK